MDDPYRYFRVEASELIEGLVAGVMDLERGGAPAEVLARLLRIAHTLKGAARVVRQPEIAEGAHNLEEILSPFRDSAGPVPRHQLDAILGLVDAMAERLAALDRPPDDRPRSSDARSAVEQVRTVRTDVAAMDALLEGIAEAAASLAELRSQIGQIARARTLVDLVSEQLAGDRTRAGAGRANGSAAQPAADPRAPSLVDELRRVINDANQALSRGADQVDRELQQVRDAGERLRLVPAATMFVPLERAARDVAQAQAKRVVFEARGGEVRIDAHIVASVQPALEQLVRNAVAHGTESDDERVAAGKPAGGQVTVAVTRRGKMAVFSCQDDGRGIDLGAVREAAQRRGSLTARSSPGADAGTMDPEPLLRLLLDGGLSTSRTVTEVSGRGIGLDVARDAAERLGGRISAQTELGRGTTVAIEVPLTLAALAVLVVEAGDVTTTIPLESVRATIRITAPELAIIDQRESVVFEDQAIPFLRLAAVVGRQAASLSTHAGTTRTAVVVEADGRMAALGVSRLGGTANVVVRPLPELAPASPVVSGATIDAIGDAQLVLDPMGLVDLAWQTAVVEGAAPASRAPILIIDDSLTTRMLEQGILESAGYEVDVATSGEDALVKAERKQYGLFLVDVEMPGMDGFTFVERAKARPALQDVPSIFVTSRASEHDRQRGSDLGARAHIAKQDFHERELLDHIREVLGA